MPENSRRPMLVDSHCHLQFDKYEDPLKVVADARAAGVSKLICVGTTLEDSQKAIELAAHEPNVWASVGVHPHDAAKFLDFPGASKKIKKLLTQSKVVAIGEIGLDFYKNYSSQAAQKQALKIQIEAGLSSNLPFIFHIREAWDNFWQILDSYKNITGVVHSFSAHQAQLDQALQRGFYIGLNGIMTFTKDEQQLDAAKRVPADRLLLETDAPFLAPRPLRGQTCEPKHLSLTADFLADLRGESLEELARSTTQNAVNLFKIV